MVIIALIVVAVIAIMYIFKLGFFGTQVQKFMIESPQLTTDSFSLDIVNIGTVAIKEVHVRLVDVATGAVPYDQDQDLTKLGLGTLTKAQTLTIRCFPSQGGKVTCEWCIGGRCKVVGYLDTSKVYPGDTYKVQVYVKFTNNQMGYEETTVVAMS